MCVVIPTGGFSTLFVELMSKTYEAISQSTGSLFLKLPFVDSSPLCRLSLSPPDDQTIMFLINVSNIFCSVWNHKQEPGSDLTKMAAEIGALIA